jgi:hypothetical protein
MTTKKGLVIPACGPNRAPSLKLWSVSDPSAGKPERFNRESEQLMNNPENAPLPQVTPH